jgi:hypothetical protein
MDYRIVLPEDAGVYCSNCDRYRGAEWLAPDFCCATCRLILVTVGPIHGVHVH